MALLNKLQYKKILNEGSSQKIVASDEQWDRALKYASQLLPKLKLQPRTLARKDACVVYQYGDRSLFHIRAFTRKQPDTFVIVVTDEHDKPKDHILIDMAAEYASYNLEGPQIGCIESPSEEDIRRAITSIDPTDDDPYAVLGIEDGSTYMQTFRERSGWLLEYQLVNTSSHYNVRKLVSTEQVVDAMISYAFGKDEWLEAHDWRRMNLD